MTRALDAIARLRKLEEEATPGPWTVTGGDLYAEKAHDLDGMVAEMIGCTPATYSADADLIANMRNALPALIECAEAMAAMLEMPSACVRDEEVLANNDLRARARAALEKLEREAP